MKAVIGLSDLELIGTISALLPKCQKERLAISFRKFKTFSAGPTSNIEESRYRFCRYMEMYWLVVYADQNDYSKLQEITYEEWRKKAEDIYLQAMQQRTQQITRTVSW